jgi:hypothetical protein
MQPDRQKQQDEHNKVIIQNMVEACAKFQRVFSGSEGEEVLAMIEAQVPKKVFDKDPFVHAHNQGKKELFEFIQNGLDDKKLQKNIENMKKMCKEKE